MNKILLISTLLFFLGFGVGADSLRIMPDLRKLDWQADEFSRCELQGGTPVWVVEVPPEKAKGTHGLKAAFDVSPYRGKQVTFMIRFKATGVTEPQKKYLGSKFLLHYRPAPGKTPCWPDANLPQGTTGWQTGAFTVNFPMEATDGLLRLGLQDVSGKIEFEFIAPVNSRADAAIKKTGRNFLIGKRVFMRPILNALLLRKTGALPHTMILTGSRSLFRPTPSPPGSMASAGIGIP